MPYQGRSRLSVSVSLASQTDWPPSPSAFSHQPRSANSWTARTFTTLQPSDSPSQAQFPKHSQASLLLQSRRQQYGTPPQSKQQAVVKSTREQASFLKRYLLFVALAALFHISLIVVTTLLVLIITAATATPRKRIEPGYWIGVILSFASGLASIIITYVKWNERKINLSTGEAPQPISNTINQAELGLTPSAFPRSPVDDIRAVVSNWDPSAPALAPYHVRALLAHRNHLPSASARIAGSNNRPHITDQGIEMQSLHQDHQQHPTVNNTAIELQRFLDHELERQEAIKRRIGTWLLHIPRSAPPQQEEEPPSLAITTTTEQQPSPPPPPPPPRPPHQRHHRPHPSTDPDITRIPANPARLAEIDAEIEAYLGHVPPPPLLPMSPPSIENGIDYSVLPAAVPRPGAKARDPVRSDPTTVVYVGPMKEKEVVDDFAERWMERVKKGVDVESEVEGGRRGGEGEGMGKEGKEKGWWRRG
ncbi:MAG: hypothetical protein Q9208_005331 [Pyrenodesmia sp. 3 TL-2023]